MAWSLRALLLTVLLAGAALALPAFESTLTLQGGIGVPATDRDEEVIHRGSGALSWDAWIARDLALGWNLYFATLQSRDPVVEAKARSGYHSAVEGADLYLKLRPVRYLALNYPEELIRRISPFVALGVGYAHHGSDILDAGSPNQNAYMTVFPQLAGGISLLTRWTVNLDRRRQRRLSDPLSGHRPEPGHPERPRRRWHPRFPGCAPRRTGGL